MLSEKLLYEKAFFINFDGKITMNFIATQDTLKIFTDRKILSSMKR